MGSTPLPSVPYPGLTRTGIRVPRDSVEVRYDQTPLDVRKITAEDLQGFRGDPDFNYVIVHSEPGWWEGFKMWLGDLMLRFFAWLFGGEKASGMLSEFLSWLPYILLGILFLVLIRFFLNVDARALVYGTKKGPSVSLSDEEHLIKNEDIEKLLQNAVREKDYRLAVRYYYLFILQLMSDAKHIDWQLQKTNADYLREIEQASLRAPFDRITRLYDFIWYGGFPIDELQYKRAATAFEGVRAILLSHE